MRLRKSKIRAGDYFEKIKGHLAVSITHVQDIAMPITSETDADAATLRRMADADEILRNVFNRLVDEEPAITCLDVPREERHAFKGGKSSGK